MSTDERLEKVECQLANMKSFNRVLVVCIVVLFGVWFTWNILGPKTSVALEEIRARKYVLRDENGRTRATLSVLHGAASLTLLAENGKPLAALAALENGPVLMLCDENSKDRAELKVDKDGPILSLFDENLKPIWSAP